MKSRVERVQKLNQQGRVFSEHVECGSCRVRVSRHDRYCRGCGAELIQEPVRA